MDVKKIVDNLYDELKERYKRHSIEVYSEGNKIVVEIEDYAEEIDYKEIIEFLRNYTEVLYDVIDFEVNFYPLGLEIDFEVQDLPYVVVSLHKHFTSVELVGSLEYNRSTFEYILEEYFGFLDNFDKVIEYAKNNEEVFKKELKEIINEIIRQILINMDVIVDEFNDESTEDKIKITLKRKLYDTDNKLIVDGLSRLGIFIRNLIFLATFDLYNRLRRYVSP